MKLKTVRVRRSNPSVPALAIALMLTMLCVYLVSLSAMPGENADAASGQPRSAAEVRMEGLEAAFLLEARTSNQLEARILAARCVQNGGAGLVLADGGSYCVIREAATPDEAGPDDLLRSANGLTLKLQGNSGEIAAISDAVALLRALASETGGLADAVRSGDTDLASVCSLLRVYHTQGKKALDAIAQPDGSETVPARLAEGLQNALKRLDDAMTNPDISKIKLIHAAACGEWISMLNEFAAGSA